MYSMNEFIYHSIFVYFDKLQPKKFKNVDDEHITLVMTFDLKHRLICYKDLQAEFWYEEPAI